jgi:hypothetical protein
MHHVAKYANQLPKKPEHHDTLLHQKILLLSAWMQIGLAAVVPLAFLLGVVYYWRRRRVRKTHHR